MVGSYQEFKFKISKANSIQISKSNLIKTSKVKISKHQKPIQSKYQNFKSHLKQISKKFNQTSLTGCQANFHFSQFNQFLPKCRYGISKVFLLVCSHRNHKSQAQLSSALASAFLGKRISQGQEVLKTFAGFTQHLCCIYLKMSFQNVKCKSK